MTINEVYSNIFILDYLWRKILIITCPKCQSKYQLKDDIKVEKVRCKKCQQIIDLKSSLNPEEKPKSDVKTSILTPSEKPEAEKSQAQPTVSAAHGKKSAQESAEEVKTIHTADIQKDASGIPASSKKSERAEEEEEKEDSLIGKTLGGYEIIRTLGEGGMGAVYEARQLSLDRSVALKVLAANLAADKNFIRRFAREALSVAKLNHTNIIQIYDVGKAEGQYFFAMEFVQGKTLQEMLDESGTMDLLAAVGYIIQAARGLEYAHRKNIIHRDIKPDNIMINEEGIAKVADLGLAKKMQDEEISVTLSGVAMGTPYYMAPEQAHDAKKVDQRADIYSLGCTLYHLISGRIPYDGGSAYEIITKHISEPLTPVHILNENVPVDLSNVVAKMMAKKKEERYQSMKEVVEALENYLGVNYARAGFHPSEDQITILQRHAIKIENIQKDKKSKLVLLGICGIVVLLAILSIWIGTRFAVAIAEFIVLSPLFYFMLFGSQRKTYVYRRIRKFLFGNKISDWIVVILLAGVACILIMFLNLITATLFAALFAAGTAGAFYWAVKRPLLANQDEVIDDIKRFVREIRKKGIPEEDIHLFICQHGGEFGELICEEIFGYDAAIGTRSKRSKEELEKRAVEVNLREWVINWINAAEEKRQMEKRARLTATTFAKAEVQTAQEKPVEAASESAAAGKAAETAAEPQIVKTPAAEKTFDELEKKKAEAASRLIEIPKFIIGSKGRISIAAVMILLAGLSFKGTLFAGVGVFQSYNYILFALALFISGFARSRIMLFCLFLSCLLTGPLAVYASKYKPDSFLIKPFSFLGAAHQIISEDITKNITPIFIGGLFFFILGFLAAFLFRQSSPAPKKEGG